MDYNGQTYESVGPQYPGAPAGLSSPDPNAQYPYIQALPNDPSRYTKDRNGLEIPEWWKLIQGFPQS